MIVWFSLIAGISLQLAALYGFAAWTPMVSWLLHIGGVVCFWPAFLRLLPLNPGERRLAAFLYGGAAFLVPVLGIIFAAGLALVLRARSPRPENPGYVFADEISEVPVRSRAHDAIPVPILKILDCQDPSQRQNAILALKSIEPRTALPFLRRALQDSDEQVRIFTQGILGEITDEFDIRIQTLEKEAYAEGASDELKIQLAENYHEMVYLGLILDDESRHGALEKVISILEDIRSRRRGDMRVLKLLMRSALGIQDIDRAEDAYRELEAHDSNEPLRAWKMEILYCRKEWEALRSEMASFVESIESNRRLRALAAFWLQTGRHPE